MDQADDDEHLQPSSPNPQQDLDMENGEETAGGATPLHGWPRPNGHDEVSSALANLLNNRCA